MCHKKQSPWMRQKNEEQQNAGMQGLKRALIRLQKQLCFITPGQGRYLLAGSSVVYCLEDVFDQRGQPSIHTTLRDT